MSLLEFDTSSFLSSGGHGECQPCPACEGGKFRRLFVKKGRTFYQCQTCGLERQWPLPSQTQLNEYYEQSYRDGMYCDFVAADEMKVRTAKSRYRQIKRWCNVGPWLDVGCANGVFLKVLQEQNIEAEGLDVSHLAVEAARLQGLQATCDTLDNLPEGRFATITAFDVLEHAIDPLAFMEEISRRLAPGGYVALSVPNLKSWSHFFMGRRWYFYIPEEHLHYFSRKNLAQLCKRVGLRVCAERATYKPLTFDYSVIQFREYNPWIYRVLNLCGKILPGRLRSASVPLYIGELLLIAQMPRHS